MNDTIENLKKRLRVMQARNSNAVTLDIDYVQKLVGEIESLELSNGGTNNVSDSETLDSENNSRIIHGGEF